MSHTDRQLMQSHQDEKSHATDSHAKQVYIIQIYTQANPRRIYGNDSMLNNTHDNIQSMESIMSNQMIYNGESICVK